jgi:hypothetical protein
MAAGNTYEAIATQTLGSSASSVTFSSIPGTYTDLVLVTSVIGTGDLQINGRVNSDTGSNYSTTYLAGNGTSAASDRAVNATTFGTDYYFSITTAGNATILQFMNYVNSTTYKTVLCRSGVASKGTNATVALWRNTAAITSITLLASQNAFNTGSTFSLYGIKAA